MPRVCWRCEGRGLLRHNTTTKDGKYLLGFIPCFCAKGKRIAAERAKNTEQLDQPDTEQPTSEEDPTMSDYTQPPEPVEPKYIRQDRRQSKSTIVWIDKDEAKKLYACRAALRECVALLDESLGYVTTNWIRNRADYVAQIEDAITNARKALGE